MIDRTSLDLWTYVDRAAARAVEREGTRLFVGQVTAVDGQQRVQVRRPWNSAPDGPYYPRLNTYWPQVGDWVVCLETMGGVIVLGQQALSGQLPSHGNQSGGSLHAAATQSTAGFMSAADKQKLDRAEHGGLSARASSNLTLTTSYQNVPGASVTLDRSGTWLIVGIFDVLVIGTGDNYVTIVGACTVGGVQQTGLATFAGETGSRSTVVQSWRVTGVSSGQAAALRATKESGSGSSLIANTNTTITAVWLSP